MAELRARLSSVSGAGTVGAVGIPPLRLEDATVSLKQGLSVAPKEYSTLVENSYGSLRMWYDVGVPDGRATMYE